MTKRKIVLIIAIIIILILILGITIDRKPYNNLFLEYNEDIGVYIVNNDDNLLITDKNYQDDISKLIYNKLNNKLYLANNPLMILNPYGTNITGIYINFFTFSKTKIEYTISIEGEEIPDFTNTLNGGLTNFHKGQIIGLLQGYENTITIKLINKHNKIKNSYKFKINVPDYHTNSIKRLDSSYSNLEEISEGLYITCSTKNMADYTTKPLSFYDINGILRAEFTKNSGSHSFRLEFVDDKLIYAIEPTTYVHINNLGKIEKMHKLTYYSDHEIRYNPNDNSIIYIHKEEKIRKLNLSNNSDTLLADLGDLLTEYKNKVYQYHREHYNYYKTIDWLHLNSIEIVNENDIIVSARQTSSIIYISNVYTNPEIKYIIAPETIYQNTQYTKYLLKQVGDFPVHAGQHAVTIQRDDNLKKHQYYLIFYNNNYAPPKETIFNTGWETIIDGVGKDGTPAEYSAYYKYLVDEQAKTYTLVDSIKTPYSRMISNVQIIENGYLINSGTVATIEEYNMNKELILTLKSTENNTFYRVYKYDMKSFWFDNTYSYTK